MTTIKLYQHHNPRHVYSRVFMGPDEQHLGFCGVLCMTHEEEATFSQALAEGVRIGVLEAIFEGELDSIRGEVATKFARSAEHERGR